MIGSGIISQSAQNILIWCVTLYERDILVLSHVRYSKLTSELITFNHLNSILVQDHWELELVAESQLGEVQMKPPTVEEV